MTDLKDNRKTAVLLQIITVLLPPALLAAEWGLHFLSLMLPTLPDAARQAGCLGLILLLDLLLLSPFKGGKAAFFRETAAEKSARGLVTGQYRQRFWRSIGWRLRMWGTRLAATAVTLLPGTVLLAALRWQLSIGAYSAAAQMVLLLTLFFCGFCFLAGLAAAQLFMLRYMPAAYYLEDNGIRQAVKLSKKAMKGRTGEAVLFYIKHSGWLLAGAAGVPVFWKKKTAWLFE